MKNCVFYEKVHHLKPAYCQTKEKKKKSVKVDNTVNLKNYRGLKNTFVFKLKQEKLNNFD